VPSADTARPTFLERLAEGVLLADGAMGTVLYNRGVSFDRSFDALCETDPEIVRSVHRDYIAAGAELIETNTFGANALRLADHGLEGRVRAINLAGARLAREVADAAGGVWVAGSVGPLGVPIAPLGALQPSRARALFAEQIAALAEGGVDVIVIETMRYLGEALAAIEATREVCDLPVIALVTFGEDELTATGRRPEEIARALDGAGADVIGTNCSTGPALALDVAARMRTATTRPLCAMPNAGLPTVSAGRYYYTASPIYTAEVATDMVAAGVAIVGGCCGTTPEHVSAIRDALRGRLPNAPRLGFPVAETTGGPATATMRGPTGLQRALGERFVVTVEVDPPRGFNFHEILPALRMLRDSGAVDAIDVADNPRAQARLSALVMSALIQSQVGLEPVVHVGCRHRNLVAVNSDLLGAHALGVRNIFVVMGDLPANGDYPDATVNSDITATGLMRLLARFNEGMGLSGHPLTEPTGFHIGCAFNFGAADLDKERRLLDKKIASGAQFALSQPVYDPRIVERALDCFEGGRFPIPVLAGVLPLWNGRHAAFLHHEVPGIGVPEDVLRRMERAGVRGRDEGVAVAREVLAALQGMVNGAYFMPPFGKYDVVPEIMSGLRTSRPPARAAR
jgi:methionine synthase / methylenetetrahydrofolate reductase(NADPH)